MTWRDTYRPATFRGVAFFVESADSSHGRRQAVHEAAQRDIPYTEDLGRKSREFSITGYLLGKDYHLNRDDLIKACEVEGPGVLVHPYRGEMSVVCRGLNVSESSSEGGKCTIALTFLEAGEASYPSTKVDTVNAISAKSNQVTEVAKSDFVSSFLTTGYPAFVADAAKTKVQELSDFLSSPQAYFSANLQAASGFYSQVQNIGSAAFSLVQEPLSLAGSVVDIVGSIRSAFGSNALSMLKGLFDQYDTTDATVMTAATPSRQQQVTNANAINTLVRQAVIAESAIAAVVTQTTPPAVAGNAPITTSSPTTYDSYEAAITVRDDLATKLDEESEATLSDSAYAALTDLRTAVIKAVPDPEQTLPRLVQYAPRETLPSLLVAYQLYGDASRSGDIVTRNAPRHPGFLIGGQRLEVLADG